MRSECASCVLRTARRLVCLEPREQVGRGGEMSYRSWHTTERELCIWFQE